MIQKDNARPFKDETPSVCHGESPVQQHVLFVSGMSGAGKTTALKTLEDHGYESVDHVPLSMLGRLLKPTDDELVAHGGPLAIGVDVRTRGFSVEALTRFIETRRSDSSLALQLVFLECDDEVLRRRYSATRRRHPLAAERSVNDAIVEERQMLAPLRKQADVTIDTTDLNHGQLKVILEGYFGLFQNIGMVIHVTSFSYRNGLPREADLVFDVRFLTNPFYNADLKLLTGLDQAVEDFISGDPMFQVFFDSLTQLLDPLVLRYAEEGKSYLTIAVGCTGGRHRSVFVAEKLASQLRHAGRDVSVFHRDLMNADLMTTPMRARAR